MFLRQGAIIIGLILAGCSSQLDEAASARTGIHHLGDYETLGRLPVGSRVQFGGYFEISHERVGIYLSRRDYVAGNDQCVPILPPGSHGAYVDGRRYSIRGVLRDNPCATGHLICFNICGGHQIEIESVSTTVGRAAALR